MSWRRIAPRIPGEAERAAWRLVGRQDELAGELERLAGAIAAECGRQDRHGIRLQLDAAIAVELAWLLAR